jgi:hypothetical protein
MVRVAAVGGHQAKLALVEVQGELALDGAERVGASWRPTPVEPAQPLMDALNEALSQLEPTPSALQMLLNEKLS